MRPTPPRLRASLAALTLALPTLTALGGCTTTRAEAMLPPEIDIVSTHESSVVISAEGTARRMGIGPPFIAAAALQSAVEEAVLQSELFSAITTEEHAAYRLHLQVTEFEKPETSLDMKAAVSIRWSLSDPRGQSVLWMESVTTSFMANTIDSSDIQGRLQTAIEGALRENLELGLHKVSELELPSN